MGNGREFHGEKGVVVLSLMDRRIERIRGRIPYHELGAQLTLPLIFVCFYAYLG